MLCRTKSGLLLEEDIVLRVDSENTDDAGEEGRESGRLKEREKLVLAGGVELFSEGDEQDEHVCKFCEAIESVIVNTASRSERYYQEDCIYS